MQKSGKRKRGLAWLTAVLLIVGMTAQNPTLVQAETGVPAQSVGPQEAGQEAPRPAEEAPENAAEEEKAAEGQEVPSVENENSAPAEGQAVPEQEQIEETVEKQEQPGEQNPVPQGAETAASGEEGAETPSLPEEGEASALLQGELSAETAELKLNTEELVGSAEQSGVRVHVRAPEQSFPEGTTLRIVPLGMQWTTELKEQIAEEGEEKLEAVGFDISFFDREGNKVQPADGKTVAVTFELAAESRLSESSEDATLSVYHIPEEGAPEALLTQDAPAEGEGTALSVEAVRFSPYVAVLRRAPGMPKKADINITKLELLKDDGKKTPIEAGSEIMATSGFYLSMNWKLAESEMVKEGDYFEVQIPEIINLTSEYTVKNFILSDPDGKKVADAAVTPGADGGGTIRATFTKDAEGKYNLQGNMYLYAFFYRKKIKEGESNQISVTVNGTTWHLGGEENGGVIINTPPVPPKPTKKDILAKWSAPGKDGKVQWTLRINWEGQDLNDVVITDELQTENGEYLEDSFILQEVVHDDYGHDEKIKERIEASELKKMLKIADDRKSFKLELGDIGTKQYRLYYKTTLLSGKEQKNRAALTANGIQKETKNTYILKGAGGTGDGDLAKKIKLVKVDASKTETRLAGAEFQVEKKDDSSVSFSLTTDGNGEAVSGLLVSGIYIVKETKAPKGYKLADKEYELTVTAENGAIQTITNIPLRTISVEKRWEGGKGTEAVVHLLADDAETGKQITLNEGNSWKGVFEELDGCRADGTPIRYTLREDAITGYTAAITGDAESGFTVTNTKEPGRTPGGGGGGGGSKNPPPVDPTPPTPTTPPIPTTPPTVPETPETPPDPESGIVLGAGRRGASQPVGAESVLGAARRGAVKTADSSRIYIWGLLFSLASAALAAAYAFRKRRS